MHEKVTVRSATTENADAWLEMRLCLWPEYGEQYHPREVAAYFRGELHMPLEVLLAFDGENTAVGFAELSIRPYAEGCQTERVGFLEGWYVKPHVRRQGVGRALVEAGEGWARARGCSEFGSDADLDNLTSAAAHAALGFRETAQIRCFLKELKTG